ncbi:hypothetical protein BH09PSE6_BH09PSE6_13640 [soil metagenome]
MSHAQAIRWLEGKRLLVVDDNPLNQEVAMALLTHVGADVTVVGNGHAAVRAVCDRRFDCVIMDVQMPVMDGIEATRLIRDDPLTASTKVVAMTAVSHSAMRERCLLVGMDEFIAKPVESGLFYETIARVLSIDLTPAPIERVSTPAISAAIAKCDPQILDLEALSKFVAGRIDRLGRYVSMYDDSMRATADDLDQALANRDVPAVANIGHRMKSSSRLVGARGVVSLCEALERVRHDTDPGNAAAIVARIKDEFERIHAQTAVLLEELTDDVH